MTPSTITEDYRTEQQRLHQNPRYGIASVGYAPLVRALLHFGRCESLSDYGAGKQKLKSALDGAFVTIDYRPYDPAFPEYGEPRTADLITCIDVLEHVEPALLDTTLDELAALTSRLALLTVHTGPAKKMLSDGRNAHLTQQPAGWWLPKLDSRFDVLAIKRVRKGFFAIVCPRQRAAEVTGAADMRGILRAAKRCNPRPRFHRRAWRAAKHVIGAAGAFVFRRSHHSG